MSEIDESNLDLPADPGKMGEGILTAKQAAQRASVVVLTVGLVELSGIAIPLFLPAGGLSGGNGASGASGGSAIPVNGWTIVLALSGLVYVLCGIPIRYRVRPAVWAGMVAALAQVIVFVMLVILGVVAGIRSGNPGTLTMAVLLFGTIASIHYFVLRWLWSAR